SYAYITFDDDVEIKGTLGAGSFGYTITFANGVLNGNELTVKVVKQVGNVISVGDEIVLTIVDKQTVTIKSGNFQNLDYTFVGFVLNYVA
ncbi:MAG: hypothetical protein SOT09_00075, partial [Candidatus Borkfalkiaceae bacterium]|nr:hypothetical protein [Christensenellaceae bacterium]